MAEGNVDRELGELRGLMSGIIDRLDSADRRADRADESRKRTHERLDEMASDLGSVKTRVESVDGKVDRMGEKIGRMEPEIELVRNLRGKAGGAVVVLGAIGALIWWGLTTFWDQIRAGIGRALGG